MPSSPGSQKRPKTDSEPSRPPCVQEQEVCEICPARLYSKARSSQVISASRKNTDTLSRRVVRPPGFALSHYRQASLSPSAIRLSISSRSANVRGFRASTSCCSRANCQPSKSSSAHLPWCAMRTKNSQVSSHRRTLNSPIAGGRTPIDGSSVRSVSRTASRRFGRACSSQLKKSCTPARKALSGPSMAPFHSPLVLRASDSRTATSHLALRMLLIWLLVFCCSAFCGTARILGSFSSNSLNEWAARARRSGFSACILTHSPPR